MTDTEKKDKIVSFLNEKQNRTGSFQIVEFERIFEKGTMNFKEMRYLIEQIQEDGYLKFDGSRFNYIFETSRFVESGGYKERETQKEIETKKKDELEEITLNKTIYETKLAKWQVQVFWPLLGFTVIGSILGIISFFIQVF
jgi:hypothetical protein